MDIQISKIFSDIRKIKEARKTLTDLAFEDNKISYPTEFEAIRTGVNALDKAEAIEPKGQDVCTCPKCDTYNETIKKRRNTVAIDIVFCWHCGQALLIKQTN